MTDTLSKRALSFREALLSWGAENRREFRWREPDRSLYDVFVAEFFLTQTPAENVANVYPDFVREYPSLEAIRRSDPDEIESAIEPLGFQRMRTEALVEIASEHTTLPRDRDELLALTRVGPYIADATLCFALELPLPIVDRNVVRVYDRIFADEFPQSDAAQRDFAGRMLPNDGAEARRYNFALLDFGATICEKMDPKCERCFAADYCAYFSSQRES